MLHPGLFRSLLNRPFAIVLKLVVLVATQTASSVYKLFRNQFYMSHLIIVSSDQKRPIIRVKMYIV
jgi:hypothetical protein